MTNQVWGRHTKHLTTSQDNTKEVSTNEWNDNINRKGHLGFDAITLASASSITPPAFTSTVGNQPSSLIKLSGSTTVNTIAITNTSDGDLLYVITTGTVALGNTATPSTAGDIKLLTNANKNLDANVPTILIRSGNFWYEYGGGTVEDGSITTAKLADDSVTTGKIVDGTIVDADINASAAIAYSKLALTNTILNADLAGSIANTKLATDPLDRANHTGSQAQGTITDLTTDLGLKAPLASPTFTGTVTIPDLIVNGTTTTINSTTLTVDDKNIEMGSVATPSDSTANGGGITLKGATDKTINWDSVNSNWTSSEHLNVASGKSIKINNTSVLNATTLGTGVTASSLTSVGIITTGVWDGTTIAVDKGGTELTTYTTGDLIYSSATDTLAKLAAGTNTHVLTLASGVPTWAAPAGGGATLLHSFTNSNVIIPFTVASQAVSFDVGTTVATQAAGTGGREIYIRKIDANNEGVFTLIHKNGAIAEVQIA